MNPRNEIEFQPTLSNEKGLIVKTKLAFDFVSKIQRIIVLNAETILSNMWYQELDLHWNDDLFRNVCLDAIFGPFDGKLFIVFLFDDSVSWNKDTPGDESPQLAPKQRAALLVVWSRPWDVFITALDCVWKGSWQELFARRLCEFYWLTGGPPFNVDH